MGVRLAGYRVLLERKGRAFKRCSAYNLNLKRHCSEQIKIMFPQTKFKKVRSGDLDGHFTSD